MEDTARHYTPLPALHDSKGPSKEKNRGAIFAMSIIIGLLLIGAGVFAYTKVTQTPSSETTNDVATFADDENLSTSTNVSSTGTCIKPTVELEVECLQCNGDISTQE